MRNVVIQTEQLTKLYGRQRGVENLTFEVEPGEVYGLLGPAGAGKTTILRVLLGLLRPTRGGALVLGQDILRGSTIIRQRVGYLPARLALYDNLTGEQLLTYLASLQSKRMPVYFRSLAEQLCLDLHRPIRFFDASDRQKVGLVQAFMHRPELVLLDEPCRSLDALTQQAFFDLVGQTRADGRAVVIATSQPADAKRVCDRVAVMQAGLIKSIERVIQFKSRALRRVEIRFGGQVPVDAFNAVPNLHNLSIDASVLRCMVKGEPDQLIKVASQYRITDLICRETNLEDVLSEYYGGAASGA
jgi:ABC-2 type transport system ATP-binding protein